MKLGRLMSAGPLRVLAAAGLMMAALAAQAQNAIESMNVTQQGGTTIIKVNMKDEPANPPEPIDAHLHHRPAPRATRTRRVEKF